MKQELLSVGIDLGTSTTQLIFSRLLIENMASSYTVPRMVITKKEVQYKSDIYFTPLVDASTIDFEKVREIVAKEYDKAGVKKEDIDTGAVIITGETARKENAREVLSSLSGYAGDFVVATAGPDLESVISGKGAGTDLYTKEHAVTAVNVDIGGGTSNLAVFRRGDTVDTGCLDVGGRLIKVDQGSHIITYIAPKLKQIIAAEGLTLAVGQEISLEKVPEWKQAMVSLDERNAGESDKVLAALHRILGIMTEALEQGVGLRDDCKYYNLLITNHGLRWVEKKNENKQKAHGPMESSQGVDVDKGYTITDISFSGGVAAILYHTDDDPDPFQFGDIGILLAEHIRASRMFASLNVIESTETIRATVVGAGSHTTKISGSTITYREAAFPIKNLPVLKLTPMEEAKGSLPEALKHKLKWYQVEGKLQQVAVALDGEENPTFQRIQEYAGELLDGMNPLINAGFSAIVVTKQDMAKVLGQTMYGMMVEAGCDRKSGIDEKVRNTLICLDGISLSEGDYIDIGKPAAEGTVLPVVVKTLVFDS